LQACGAIAEHGRSEAIQYRAFNRMLFGVKTKNLRGAGKAFIPRV
jgi:hypothetical protein